MDHHFLTVDSVVVDLLFQLSKEDKQYIQKIEESELFKLHFALGMSIRNKYGLWAGNQKLLDDCGSNEPDNASSVIIKRLWQELNN